MIEDIISLYKEKCTRQGQFSFVLSTPIMYSVTLLFVVILYKLFYPLLKDFLTASFLFTFLCLSFCLAVIIYCVFAEAYIFRKEREYLINVIEKLEINENNESVKEDAKKLLITLNSSCFQIKNTFKPTEIGKLYDIVKFDEFLDAAKIDNRDKAIDLEASINEYLKNKKNFRVYINLGLVSTLLFAILYPIIEYAQAIYIPNTSTEFNEINLLQYLITVSIPIIFMIFIYSFIHNLNHKKINREKHPFLRLNHKLNNYDFTINKLEKYTQIKLNNKENQTDK